MRSTTRHESQPEPTRNNPVYFCKVCLLLLLLPVLVAGQTGTVQGTRGKPDPIQTELQRRFELEAIEQVLARSSHRGGSDRSVWLAQIRADFLRIQILNDEIQQTMTSDRLDLKLITFSAAEITRCARRLRSNLALPKNERATEAQSRSVELSAMELRLALATLNSAINSFVANPVFEKVGVIDAQLSTQASRDLELIIARSIQAKRTGEKLIRTKAE